MPGSGQRRSTRWRGPADLLILLAVWLPYAALAWRFWFVCDDAFISYRYARNLAGGHGLRYNLGGHPPVEGYSNFLWVILSAGVEWLGARPGIWMPLLSLACGMALLAVLYQVLRADVGASRPIAGVSVLTLAVFPPFAIWSSGGLATMAHALLVFALFVQLAMERDGPLRTGVAALMACALILLRAEGAAWLVLVAASAALSRRLSGREWLRPLGRVLAPAAVILVLHLAWRWSYYGALLPNTAHAKVDLAAEAFVRGGKYVALYFLTYLSPLLVFGAAVAGIASGRRAIVLPAGLVWLANLGYAVAVSGDFMTSFRLLVPGMAFGALLLGMAGHAAWHRWSRARPGILVGAGLALIVALLPAWNLHLVPEAWRSDLNFRKGGGFRSELGQWNYMVHNGVRWRLRGMALREYAPPSASLVVGAIGLVGYYSELFIHDPHGLVSPDVVRKGNDRRFRSPGHDIVVEPSFFLDARPTILYSSLVGGRNRASRALRLWRASEFAGYAPHLARPEILAALSEPLWLLVLRRVEDERSRAELWEDYERDLAALPLRSDAPLDLE